MAPGAPHVESGRTSRGNCWATATSDRVRMHPRTSVKISQLPFLSRRARGTWNTALRTLGGLQNHGHGFPTCRGQGGTSTLATKCLRRRGYLGKVSAREFSALSYPLLPLFHAPRLAVTPPLRSDLAVSDRPAHPHCS
jgi:hypothetical protein